MIRRITALVFILSFGIVFSGCSLEAKPAEVETETPTVTLSGVITAKSGGYMISETGKNTDLESRKINLGSFVGKNVKVVGEYSGTTLFVDSIE